MFRAECRWFYNQIQLIQDRSVICFSLFQINILLTSICIQSGCMLFLQFNGNSRIKLIMLVEFFSTSRTGLLYTTVVIDVVHVKFYLLILML